ncbi:MAG TPA: hypothetical protein VG537_06045, partial [Candidatus Kapabacteria bacterium]|nr:hypothetical protein [Candidatus Kapabacteria bacterium]
MTSRRMMAGVFAIAATLTVSTAQSQTYKPDWATKVVLPSAGADITKQFTIQAGTMSGALSWRLPINAGGAGYVLTTDGSASGILSWTDPATGVTLTGDANGPAGSNTVSSYNNGTTFGDMAHEVSSSVSITGGSITGLTSLSATTITGDLTGNVTGDVTGNLTGNVTGDVLGDLTGNVTGNVTGNLSGNVTGGTGSFTGLSATGVVDFSGATSLTLPAGSVGLSSLALTNGHIAVGDISGHAADVAMSGDASISNAGLVTVSKYNNGTSFGTMAAENSSGVSITGGSITGTSISGSTGSFTGGLTSTTSSNSVGLTITNAGTGNDVTGSSWSVSHLGVITARGLDAGSFTITTTGTVSGGTGSFTTLNASGNETVTGTASIDAAPSTGGTNV